MSEHDGFRDGYCPGGMTTAAKRRQQARKAGQASGAARRQRSTCKRTRYRSRQQAIALRYKIRQVAAAEFERRYARMCEADGIPFDRRGLRSCHELYKALLRSYRVQGQDWETTNSQLARAMEIAGRGRCRRTVQRIRQRLVAMGLIAFEHVRRSGRLRIRGQLDSLRCRCLPVRREANVTPPSGAGAEASCLSLAPALPTKKANKHLLPPPSAADEIGPAAPAESTKERLERDLAFVQLKIDMGFGNTTRLAVDRALLQQQLRYAEDGSGQDTALTLRKRSLGFR